MCADTQLCIKMAWFTEMRWRLSSNPDQKGCFWREKNAYDSLSIMCRIVAQPLWPCRLRWGARSPCHTTSLTAAPHLSCRHLVGREEEVCSWYSTFSMSPTLHRWARTELRWCREGSNLLFFKPSSQLLPSSNHPPGSHWQHQSFIRLD